MLTIVPCWPLFPASAVYFFDVHGFGRSQPSDPLQRALIWDYTHLVSSSRRKP
jgi:hypothetical protein